MPGNKGFAFGLFLTAMLAAAAKMIAELPGFQVFGPLVLAIVLGMAYRHFAGGVPAAAGAGISFASKTLLRAGIVLLGMRLNLGDIVSAGPRVLAIDVIHIAVTIPFVAWIASRLGTSRNLGLLTACGTAICGAAAVAAISPQLKAKEEETAAAAAVVAILGTIFTLIYTLLYPVLGMSASGYGIFSGSTLHEVAHVLAAAAPGGREAVDMAVVVKLGRVAMLVPVALLLGMWTARKSRIKSRIKSGNGAETKTPVTIPWFIFGFLAVSAIHTTGLVPEEAASALVTAAYLLIAMAMAGLGLGVDVKMFRRLGPKAFAAGLAGSVLLTAIGFGLVHLLGLAQG
ncbi:YeiH family protein [Paenibacillus sp. D51F]